MRLLALDIGLKTIGLAISDAGGNISRPLATIRRRGFKSDLAELEKIFTDHGIEIFIVGYPLHISGDKNEATERVEHLVKHIRRRFDIPVIGVDERYSTLEAEEILNSMPGKAGRSKRGIDLDAVSAALILNRYLQENGAIVKTDW